MAFPSFSEYEDIFSTPLHPTFFASLFVPAWVPAPPKLTPMAKAIYSYWKERRLERNGQRIIPTLNVSVYAKRQMDPDSLSSQFDESDVTNESYVCFRRRELKAVRKTRAAQVTFSDKLARLQAEFAAPLEMTKIILHREKHKLARHKAAHYIFQRRLELSILKQRNQSLREHNDDDVMIDRERPRKESVFLVINPSF
jgi:enhancer of polycomb-like protein